MKIFKIRKIKFEYIFLTLLVLGVTSCTFEDLGDPDRPSIEGFENASKNQLNNLVVGIQSTMRNSVSIQTTASGTMARELYLFDADPRNTTNLLGGGGSSLENGDFYVTAPWGGRYRAIANANLLIKSATNSTFITAQERVGYIGFAETIIAFELIEVLKSYGKARIDVVDPDNLGQVLDLAPALTQVRAILESGLTNLNQAGAEFAFKLSGYEDFIDPPTIPQATPAMVIQFNRAIAANAALYDKDKTSALAALTASYFDIAGDITVGPKHVFSQGSGDITNDLFKVENNNGNQIIVHDSFIAEAEAGDTRVTSKTVLRADPSVQDDLTGTRETRLYATNTSPIDMLRNEELILVYAEANIGTNVAQAVAGINKVRAEAGLPAYAGATDDASLVTELLNQRRYSLWSENHRLFDLRRYNLNSTLPIDRAGDQIFDVFPIPFAENGI